MNIVVLKRGGNVIRYDKKEPWNNMRIRTTLLKKVPVDVLKEKWVFFDAQNEFVDRNHSLTSSFSPVFDEHPILT